MLQVGYNAPAGIGISPARGHLPSGLARFGATQLPASAASSLQARLPGPQSHVVTYAKNAAQGADLSPAVEAGILVQQPSQQDANFQFLDHNALIRNLDTYDEGQDAASTSGRVQVPQVRLITDPRELDLIGDGLPVVFGPDWHVKYFQVLEQLSKGEEVAVPKPHAKFTIKDLERIKAQGPSINDIVLEHAERLRSGPEASTSGQSPLPTGPNSLESALAQDEEQFPAALAYRYIPRSVLGDYGYEQEPNWAEVPQMSIFDLYQGLRARCWSSGHFKQDAEPWRLQFFSCGYTHAPTAWPGWRCLVSAPGRKQAWVNMPTAGQQSLGGDTEPPAELSGLGYRHVFGQLYSAMAQRVPPELLAKYYRNPASVDLARAQGVDAPGLALLDVSYHPTPARMNDPLQAWLSQPSLGGVTEAIRWGLDHSGILELKQGRDMLLQRLFPPQPEVSGQGSGATNNLGVVYFLVCLTLGIVVPAMRRSRILDIKTLEEDPGAAMEFARSKSEARKEGLTGVEFTDVAGLTPILNEVVEVVEFLKEPKQFSKLGARPPKGILLEGDPGTGKTLLAKALAGEAMVPFYQMSGTEFTEGIVGLGAARVRDLFKRARATAPCIIFVDEVDALGLKRSDADSSKTNEEREQTLNQLLTEMDGFTPDVGVVFLAATNRADLLDPALLRPGRFDRKIRMPKPDTEGRYEILKLHLRNKEVAPDVDLMQLARDLPGLVGADLANIVNEAALAAVRSGRSALTARDIYAGVDRFTQGETRPALPDTYKLPILSFAAKEAGIALVAELLRRQHGRIEPVERVSIQPKGRSYSRTLFQRGPDEDYQVMTRGKLLDRMKLAVAGSIATRVIIGEETNFAIADIKRVTRMAHKYVFLYGLSDIGITCWASQPYSTDFMISQQRSRKVVSQDAMDEFADMPTRNEDFRFDPPSPSDVTWHRYTDEVRRVVKSCYEEVWGLLVSHKDALWAGVGELKDKKELLGFELRDIFDAHPPIHLETPPKLDMVLFTQGKDDRWPYGIEWLNDAYPIPYFVKQQMEADEAAKKQQGSEGGDGGKQQGTELLRV